MPLSSLCFKALESPAWAWISGRVWYFKPLSAWPCSSGQVDRINNQGHSRTPVVWSTGLVGSDWPEVARKHWFRRLVLAGFQNEGHWSAGSPEGRSRTLGSREEGRNFEKEQSYILHTRAVCVQQKQELEAEWWSDPAHPTVLNKHMSWETEMGGGHPGAHLLLVSISPDSD